MFRRVAGLPALPRMDLAAQRHRTMSRCQRTIVSGVTRSRSPERRALRITPSSAASRARFSDTLNPITGWFRACSIVTRAARFLMTTFNSGFGYGFSYAYFIGIFTGPALMGLLCGEAGTFRAG